MTKAEKIAKAKDLRVRIKGLKKEVDFNNATQLGLKLVR